MIAFCDTRYSGRGSASFRANQGSGKNSPLAVFDTWFLDESRQERRNRFAQSISSKTAQEPAKLFRFL